MKHVQREDDHSRILLLFTVASSDALGRAEGVLATVSHVQEAVLILVFFIDGRHQRSCQENNIDNLYEESL